MEEDAKSGHERDDLVWAALATLFCCPPYGIAATMAAHRARVARAEDDHEAARVAADSARRNLWRSVIIGLILYGVAFAALAWEIYYAVTHWDQIKGALSWAAPAIGWPVLVAGIALMRPRIALWLTAGIVSLGLAALVFVDPEGHTLSPRCLVFAWSGWQCPGCGTLRAFHALLGDGDIPRAIQFQPLLVLVPAAAVLFMGWRPASGTARRTFDRRAGVVAVALLVAFGVARNLSWAGH